MKKSVKTMLAAALCLTLGVAALGFSACGGEESSSGDSSDSAATYTVTFDPNYDGAETSSVEVTEGETVAKPDDPERSGYVFDSWYTDADATEEYDFSTAVTSDFTLYGNWYDEGTVVYTVTYHYNYDDETQTVKVVEGKRLTTLSLERDGYVLLGWYTDEDFTTYFSSGTKVTSNLDLYARWGQTYVMEAEYVDLSDFSGQGFSGGADGVQAIFKDSNGTYEASNGYYLTYMYRNGLSISFDFTSDEAVTDAQLTLRITCEKMDISISSSNFTVAVNGSAVSYASISLTQDAAFADYTISTSVSLVEGDNSITLTTSNSDAMAGTMYATAPMIDCIKVTSASTLVMDEYTSNLDKFNQD